MNVLTVDTRLYSPPITELPNLRTFSFILFPVKSRLFLLIPWRLPVNYYLNIIQLFTRYYIWCHCYKVILQVFILLWEGIWYQMIPCQWYQNLISIFYQKKKKKSNKCKTCHQKITTSLTNERRVLMGSYFYTHVLIY